MEVQYREFRGVSVNNFFKWYTGNSDWATNDTVIKDLEDNDIFFDLVPDKFKTYKELVKFLKDHAAYQMILKQEDLGNTFNMKFTIDDVNFDLDAVDEYGEYKNR